MEGLPDWRMPAYYFRRMRKIGLAEGLAYLLGNLRTRMILLPKRLFYLKGKPLHICNVGWGPRIC